jgi:O-antigen/teichoic acid export membrane protein
VCTPEDATVSDPTPSTGPEPAAGAPPEPGLAQKARLAVFWTTGFQLFWDLLQFGVTIALVRILPAEAYGQFGFVTALIGFLTLYSFREVLGYTLQVRDPRDTHYQDQFTAGIVIQVAMFVITNVVALVLRWLPTYAAASPVLHIMSITFLLDLPGELRNKMLERALDWRRLRTLHAIGLLLCAGASIAMALRGWGAYALLVPTLLLPVPVIYDLFVVERWRPTWRWDWRNYRPAWRFGSARMAAVSFVSGAQLMESSWLVRVAGFAALGIFGRALGLSQRSCQRVGQIVATSVYPVLTRVQPRTDAYRRASAMFLRSVAWLVLPIAAVTGLLASQIVHILYGQRWDGVIPLLPWAMAGGAVAAIVQTAYTLLLAHQRQDLCLRADVWRFVGTGLMLLVALPFGIQTYLASAVVIHVVSLGLVLYWLHADQAVSWPGMADAFLPPVVAAGGGLALAIGLRFYPAEGAAALIQAAAQAAVFGSAYVLILRLGYRAQLRELVGYLPEPQRLNRWLRFQEAA